MDFLNILNVVIGMSFLMLLLSMVVTGITQVVMSLVNSKGGNLRDGIADLLGVFGIAERDIRDKIADALLRHPLVADSPLLPGTTRRLGTVIQREELAQLLMDLAGDNPTCKLDDVVKTKLAAALQQHGISNPEEVLEKVRTTAMEIEVQTGALTTTQRSAMALYEAVDKRYLSKIHATFDRTIERVISRFTASARVYTLVIAIFLAAGLQIDSIAIVNRLYADRETQAKVIAAAQMFIERNGAPDNASDEQIRQEARDSFQQLVSLDLVGAKLSFPWPVPWGSVPGILVTVILLSLGAPFWYNVLKNAIQLRSMLAVRDDVERAERQIEGGKKPDETKKPPPPEPAAP